MPSAVNGAHDLNHPPGYSDWFRARLDTYASPHSMNLKTCTGNNGAKMFSLLLDMNETAVLGHVASDLGILRGYLITKGERNQNHRRQGKEGFFNKKFKNKPEIDEIIELLDQAAPEPTHTSDLFRCLCLMPM